jgi:integrase
MYVEDLKPLHVQQWLDQKRKKSEKRVWSNGHCRGVITALKGGFNWAVRMEMISKNPLLGLEKPAPSSRERFLTGKEFDALLAAVKSAAFKCLLQMTWYTGARPQEIARLEARHVRGDHAVFPKDESKGKERERVIFLVPEAQAIIKKAIEKYPTGPLFRNTRGAAWTKNAISQTFGRLEEELGEQFCLYTIRHSYAHHALTEAKLAPEIVAR